MDTTVSNTSVLDNSTSGLDDALEARQCKYDAKTPSVSGGRRIHLEWTRAIKKACLELGSPEPSGTSLVNLGLQDTPEIEQG